MKSFFRLSTASVMLVCVLVSGCNLPVVETSFPPLPNNFSNYLKRSEIPITGTAYNHSKSKVTRSISPLSFDPYAYVPRSLIHMSANESYSIAWYDFSTSTIKITNISKDDKSFGEDLTVPVGEKCDYLAGFDRTSSGEYVVAYMQLASTDHGGKLKICKVLRDNSVVFVNEVFTGDKLGSSLTLERPYSVYNPLYNGTSRVAVGTVFGTERIVFHFTYVYHTQNEDITRDSLVVYESNGDIVDLPLSFNNSSNIIDLRLFYDGAGISSFVTCVGDPLGVTFQKISSRAERRAVHPLVPGSTYNNLSFQLGDILPSGSNAYAFIAATSLRYDLNNTLSDIRNPRRDAVFYTFNGTTSRITYVQPLTFLDTGNVSNPKIASYGYGEGSYIVLWNYITNSGGLYTKIFRLVATSVQPTIFTSPSIPQDIIIEPTTRLVTSPISKDVILYVTTENKISIFRILNIPN